jgi:hypothetical protein
VVVLKKIKYYKVEEKVQISFYIKKIVKNQSKMAEIRDAQERYFFIEIY